MLQIKMKYNRRSRFMGVGVLAATLLITIVVTGCGSSADDRSEGRPQIAVIPKGTTHEFWKNIHAGAAKAGKELDVDVIWQGPHKEDDRQMQINVVQNFVSRGADAIVLAPLDARSLVRPVQAAVNRNIPVIIIDSGLESDAYLSFIATDNYEGGRLGAQRLAELVGDGGKIVMLRFQEGSASTTAREAGFLDALKEYAPNAELLVSNQYAGATMEKALQVSQNILNRFSEIDGIWCPNESSTQGMLRALQTSGRAGNVSFVGFDSNQTLIDAMRAEQLHGLVVQDPFNMGYLGVKTAVDVLNGKEVEPQIDTRLMLITPENLDSPEAQELLYPDLERWLSE